MPIAIGCTGCGKQGFVPDFAAGRLIRCFVCSTQMIAPSAPGVPMRTVRLGAPPKASAAAAGGGNGHGHSHGQGQGQGAGAPSSAGSGIARGDHQFSGGGGSSSASARMTRSSRTAKDHAVANETRAKVDPRGLSSRQSTIGATSSVTGSASISAPAPSPSTTVGGRSQTSWGNSRDSAILPGWDTVELSLADLARAEAQRYGPASSTVGGQSLSEPVFLPWQPAKPKSPQVKRLAVIAIATAAVVVLGGGVWLALIVMGFGPADTGAAASIVPSSVAANVPAPGSASLSPSPSPSPLGPGFAEAPRPTAGPTLPVTHPMVWRAQADPAPASSAQALTPSASTSALLEAGIPIPSVLVDREPAVFAPAPSPFAAIGENYDGQCDRQIFHLLTGKETGRVHYSRELLRLALSPDGRWLAGAASRWPIAAVVLDTTKNREVVAVPLSREPIFLGFAPGDRLVAADESGRVAVYERESGRLIAQTVSPGGIRRDSAIFSPGQRYLAFVTFDGGTFKALDLNSTSLALAISQSVSGQSAYEAIAFSHDGSRVAALSRAARGDYVIQTQNLKGEAETEHELSASAMPARPLRSSGTAPLLQWLPDDSGWLAFGQAIIERKSGQIVWRMPFSGDAPESPRRMLGWDRIARFEGSSNPVLKSAPLPKPEIAAALKAASQGGEAIDTRWPALQTPNLSAVQARKGEARTLWRAAAEIPAKAWTPPADAKPWPLLPGPPVERLFFATGEAPQVIVAHQSDGSARLIERVKLADSARTAQFPLAQELTPIAVSPSGDLLATSSASTRPRVDLHRIADGKHLIGWRPAQGGPEYRGGILYAAFLDETRLLLIHQSGALTLWSAREAKALYRMDGAIAGRSRFALSPSRATLACWNGAELRMIDAESGAIRGIAKLGADANLGSESLGVAFHPNGSEIAVAIGGQVAIVDINQGEAKTRVSTNLPAIRKIEFSGNSFLLLNDEALYRTDGARDLVWRFSGAATHAEESWGGSHWLIAQSQTPDSASTSAPPRLEALTMPPPSVTQAVRVPADPRVKPLIQRGQKFALIIEGLETLDPQEGPQFLRRETARALEKMGCTLDDASSVRLTIRFREERTGRTRFYAPTRSNPGLDVRGQLAAVLTKVSESKVSFDVAVEDGRQPSYPVASDFALNSLADQFRIDPAGPGQYAVRREVWLAAVRKAASLSWPPYVVRQGDQFLTLPGSTPWSDVARGKKN